jgi:hypothetical protein
MMSVPSTSNNRGEFRIENVVPGKYTIFVVPQQDSDLRSDEVPFEITDHDVAGLLLNTSVGATIAGVVALEDPADKVALSQLQQVRVIAYPQSKGGGFVQSSPIGTDGSFRIGGLPAGNVYIGLNSLTGAPLKGLVISRIEREGIVQSRMLEIKSGETNTLRIVVAYGTGIVRGIVKIENGPLPPNAQIGVHIVRTGQTAPELNSRPPAVDARGHFLIEGLPSGSYTLYVTAFIPGQRRRPPNVKQPVDVTNGRVTEVSLTLDLSANPDVVPNP